MSIDLDVLLAGCCNECCKKSCSRCVIMTHSGFNCLRYSLCFLNLSSWLIGCVLLGLGIWLHISYAGYAALLPQYTALSADSLCIALGIFIFLISFFGCCGSWFKSKCILSVYFMCVILVFIAELLVGTFGFIYRVHIGNVIKDELILGIREKYTNSSGVVDVWDHVQNEFRCCGVSSYHDWFKIPAWPNRKWVPHSCCKEIYQYSTKCGQLSWYNYFNEKGCYEMIHMWIMQRLYIVGIICMVFAFLQLFGLISAMLIICSTPRRKKRYTSKYR